MSLTSAVTNAASGLAATARGTLAIASNLANLRTPGYARRELVQNAFVSSHPNGVRVDGINRIVNESILSELRRADSAKSGSDIQLDYFKKIENALGNSSSQGGLEKLINNLRSTIIQASSRPDDRILTEKVAKSAQKLSLKFNEISQTIREQAYNANDYVKSKTLMLKTSLDEVANLNRRISRHHAQGRDHSALQDLRQAEIAKINRIVPIQVQLRDGNKVAIFTKKGMQLLDGIRPVDRNVLDENLKYYTGGELSAAVDISDNLTRQASKNLDEIAFGMYNAFKSNSADLPADNSRSPLFIMNDGLDLEEGSARRIIVNPEIFKPEPSDFWQGGAGLIIDVDFPSIEYNEKKYDKLKTYISLFESKENMGKVLEQTVYLGSSSAALRLEIEEQVSENTTWYNEISERYLETGVDSDAELQKLLEYQRAYAANARVIQAVEEMFDQIQRW